MAEWNDLTIDFLNGVEGALEETYGYFSDKKGYDTYYHNRNGFIAEDICITGDPPVLIVAEYGKRIPDKVIREYESKGGAVFNIHRADPKEYAGASVLNHQILAGESGVDVSIIRVRPKQPLDGGLVIAQFFTWIGGLLYHEAVAECRKSYPWLVERAIESLAAEQFFAQQNGPIGRRSPGGSELPLSAEQIKIIQAADNERFPAFFHLNNRKIILKAYPVDENSENTAS